jgi:hypothetical protein
MKVFSVDDAPSWTWLALPLFRQTPGQHARGLGGCVADLAEERILVASDSDPYRTIFLVDSP